MATRSQAFRYVSSNGVEGLTDVVITIKNSGGTTVVTSQAMTSKGYGVYEYILTTAETGEEYYYKAESPSEERVATGYIDVPSVTTIADSGEVVLAYCTVADVQEELQLKTAFSVSTRPTSDRVGVFISTSERRIDAETGHAWREVDVVDEYHSVDPNYAYNLGAGVRIKLGHRKVRTFDTSQGDKIEVWNGSSYIDFVTVKTEGRASDFWVDYTDGVLYLKLTSFASYEKPIRVTYRYGETSVPGDIREACTKMAAIRVLMMDDNSFNLTDPDGTTLPYDPRIATWKRDISEILRARAEIKAI